MENKHAVIIEGRPTEMTHEEIFTTYHTIGDLVDDLTYLLLKHAVGTAAQRKARVSTRNICRLIQDLDLLSVSLRHEGLKKELNELSDILEFMPEHRRMEALTKVRDKFMTMRPDINDVQKQLGLVLIDLELDTK